ncbi:ADP-ribose glycohydrolase MACROD2 [Bombina bombina]|uniref:ADP-ribose glycohydrolase MACROD2 n=1 Tax=Bombina bombina TaxID=8345 RepID=UPI00235A944E|nr:ADP-ribose glycohydrolase MACROD2 [Bombina bombina]
MDRIIFCAFLEVDVKIYEKKMNEVFPTDDDDDDNKDEDNDEEEENVQDNKDTDKISDGQAIKETESDDKHNEKSDEEEQDSSPVTSEEGTVLPKENISVEKNEDTADEEMGSQAEESQGLIIDSSNDGDTLMESQDLLHRSEVDANVETITNKSEDEVKETTQEDKQSADPKALSDDEMNSQVESMMDSQDG